jgi:zinc finger protein
MYILNVASIADLKRDVFKSETASLRIPEIDLEMCTGTLGGVFTNI